MVIGLAFLLCLATVPLAGGRLGALGDLRFRARGILYAAIGAQVLIISVLPYGSETVHNAVHLGTYVAVAAFVVANPYSLLDFAAFRDGLQHQADAADVQVREQVAGELGERC